MHCQGLCEIYCRTLYFVLFIKLPWLEMLQVQSRNFWQLTQTIDIEKMRWQKFWQLLLAALLPLTARSEAQVCCQKP